MDDSEVAPGRAIPASPDLSLIEDDPRVRRWIGDRLRWQRRFDVAAAGLVVIGFVAGVTGWSTWWAVMPALWSPLLLRVLQRVLTRLLP